MRKGITIAGNMILDYVKVIDRYPERNSLTSIRSVQRAIGGAVCNCAVDIAKLDGSLPVQALGCAGADEAGDFILSEMGAYPSIDLGSVRRRGRNSFTDVMTEGGSGDRTFFTYKGADNTLSPADFDFSAVRGELLHLGYIMLLDGLDAGDPAFGTAMARVLHDAKEAGLATSVDVVSEAGDRFRRLVPPSLKYADYAAINELEAGMVTGIPLRDGDSRLIPGNFAPACEALKSMGVARWAIIHSPELSAGIDASGRYAELASPRLPAGYIKGAVGAGDAFVSGVLLAALQGAGLAEALELGTAVAVSSLSEPGATGGVRDLGSTMDAYRKLRQEGA